MLLLRTAKVQVRGVARGLTRSFAFEFGRRQTTSWRSIIHAPSIGAREEDVTGMKYQVILSRSLVRRPEEALTSAHSPSGSSVRPSSRGP